MRQVFKYFFLLMVLPAAVISLSGIVYADTLVLRNGNRISGYYEGGTSRVIHFRTDTGVGEYDLLTVQEIRFGDDVVSSTPPVVEQAAAVPPVDTGTEPPALVRVNPETDDESVRLRTREEVGRSPVAENALNTAWTIPSGSRLMVRMIDAIDSRENEVGETFAATLAQPLLVEGIEVAPQGVDIRGRIAQVSSGGRVRGAAELRLELTRIVVNGVPYALNTAEYAEVTEGRGEETARRVGTAAGIGAIIGAIAGGGQGAAIGAGVGAGAAGTAQVLTGGEQLYIPAETLLGFTLSEPLIIAAR